MRDHTVSTVALPWISCVFQEIEAKFDQTTLAEAATKSRVLIIDTGIDNSHANSGPQVALLTQLVHSGHEMRIVIASVPSSVMAAKVMSITADVRVVGHTRDLTLNLMKFANRRDLFDGRPRRDLFNNSDLVLFVLESE